MGKRIKMQRRFTVAQKLSFSMIGFVIIPFLVLTMVSYRENLRGMEEDMINSERVVASQLADAVGSRLEQADKLLSSIALDSRLRSFLRSSYLPHLSNPIYTDQIIPLLTDRLYSLPMEVDALRLYLRDNTIPEAAGIVFRETEITGDPNYAALLSSPETGAGYIQDPETWSCCRKIFSAGGVYQGMLKLDVHAGSLFRDIQDIPRKTREAWIYDTAEQIFYTYTQEGKLEAADFHIPGLTPEAVSREEYISGDTRYLFRRIGDTDYSIAIGYDRRGGILPAGGLATLLLLSLILAAGMILFHMLLVTFFNRIHKSIQSMETIISEGFQARIAIESEDEIGDICRQFNRMIDKIQALLKDLIKKETAHKDAQFKALLLQINPHFIYNTIDMFAGKMELCGQYETADALSYFADIIRYNTRSKSIFTTLQTELSYVRAYVKLQNIQSGGRIQLSVQCREELMPIRIIRFILQPIVENAIVHNFDYCSNRRDIHIVITAQSPEKSVLEIAVADDGVGIEPGRVAAMNSRFCQGDGGQQEETGRGSIGLANINERIRLFYGEEYPLQMDSNPGQGTTVLIRIPLDGA